MGIISKFLDEMTKNSDDEIYFESELYCPDK